MGEVKPREPLGAMPSSGRLTATIVALGLISTVDGALYGEPRSVQIIPSVLPADWANMGAECKRLEDAGVDRIQFDVMDGNFVPNLTFGPELIAACRKYTKVPFETQLMVSQYACDTMLEQLSLIHI